MTYDYREAQSMTEQEADQLFNRIAVLEIALAADAATQEREIAELKARHIEATSEKAAEHHAAKDLLERYVMLHKDRFQSPKKRKTEFGSYGIRYAVKVDILDLEELYASADELELEVYTRELKHTLNRVAVRAALQDGAPLRGARLLAGDNFDATVDKSLVSAAEKEAMGK